MNETLVRVGNQVKDFWGKYSAQQKVKILAVVAVVLVALASIVLFLNQPKMTNLISGITPKEAGEIKDLFEENNIVYKVSTDGTDIKVDSKQLADAKMLLGQNGYPNEGIRYEDAFNSSFGTTESEKKLKYKLYFEQQLANNIKSLDWVSDAIVNIVVPDADRSIFNETKESTASAILKTKLEPTADQVLGVVNFLSASVERLPISNIRIVDQTTGKVLYIGESDDSVANVNSILNHTNQMSSKMRKDVTSVLLGLGLFDDAEVAVNLILDYNRQSSVEVEYKPQDGSETGVPSSTYTYESEGANSVGGGVPGTDANVDYMTEDGSASNSSTTINQSDFKVSEKTTSLEKAPGQVVKNASSVSVVVSKFKVYREEELAAQGLLDEMDFETFKQNNMEPLKIDIDEDIINIVKNATGIDNVVVSGYERPFFYNKEASPIPWTNYMAIGLLVLIIGFLAFVIYKSTAPVELVEVEPELSVEELLATTKETQVLEDIEFTDKSESRKQIEKFVEEKPDAVAQLLRNWLNEDWE